MEGILLHGSGDEARCQRRWRGFRLTLLFRSWILKILFTHRVVVEGSVERRAPDVILGCHDWGWYGELTFMLGRGGHFARYFLLKTDRMERGCLPGECTRIDRKRVLTW